MSETLSNADVKSILKGMQDDGLCHTLDSACQRIKELESAMQEFINDYDNGELSPYVNMSDFTGSTKVYKRFKELLK